MSRRAIAFLLVLTSATGVPAAQQNVPPRWSEFEGVRIGGSLDDVLALNAGCTPFAAIVRESSQPSPLAAADYAFGYSLPHHHGPADSARVMGALGAATLCHLRVLNGAAKVTVIAVERRVVAATVWFVDADSVLLALDSVRALILARWPRATEPHPRLSSWTGGRYRAHLIATPRRRPDRTNPASENDLSGRLIMVDVSACTAFDRRVHAAGHGTAETC